MIKNSDGREKAKNKIRIIIISCIAVIVFLPIMCVGLYLLSFKIDKPFIEVNSQFDKISADNIETIEMFENVRGDSNELTYYGVLKDKQKIVSHVDELKKARVRFSIKKLDEKSAKEEKYRYRYVFNMTDGTKIELDLAFTNIRDKYVVGENCAIIGPSVLFWNFTGKGDLGFDESELYSGKEGVYVFFDEDSFGKSFDEWNKSTSPEIKERLAKIKEQKYGTTHSANGDIRFFDSNILIAVVFEYAIDESNLYYSHYEINNNQLDLIFVINSPQSNEEPTQKRLFLIEFDRIEASKIEEVKIKVLNLADASRGSCAYEAAE